MKKAPKRLSTAMRIALNDLRKVEKLSKVYTVDMGTWHAPKGAFTRPDGVGVAPSCHVCFAGSVMAMTLKMKPQDTRSPGFGYEWDEVFYALDHARTGQIYEAFECLRRDPEKLHRVGLDLRVTVGEYQDSPKQFRKDMFKIIHKLESIGE